MMLRMERKAANPEGDLKAMVFLQQWRFQSRSAERQVNVQSALDRAAAGLHGDWHGEVQNALSQTAM